MGGFFITWDSYATSSSPMTAGKLYGVAGKRFEVIEVQGNGAGALDPQDIQNKCLFDFLTNAATGECTFLTPGKKDQASNASAFTLAAIKFSAEPTTYASSYTLFSFNQRSGMRWAVPEGYGFKTDGGQTNLSAGVRFLCNTPGGNVDGRMEWIEP